MKQEEVAPEKETKKPEAMPEKVEATDTVGQLLKPDLSKVVPVSKFLNLKKDNQAYQEQIKELKGQIEDGATKKEVKKGIKEIADEHNVDANFLQEFSEAVKAQAETDIDDKISSKLKPLEEKEKAEKINTIFNEQFDKVLESNPEYKTLANKDVIKTLSLDPANANKTFAQILESAYGHLVTGKKTMEASTPGGGNDNDMDIDYTKTRDPEYFKKIMSDPGLKQKYNDGLIERLKL